MVELNVDPGQRYVKQNRCRQVTIGGYNRQQEILARLCNLHNFLLESPSVKTIFRHSGFTRGATLNEAKMSTEWSMIIAMEQSSKRRILIIRCDQWGFRKARKGFLETHRILRERNRTEIAEVVDFRQHDASQRESRRKKLQHESRRKTVAMFELRGIETRFP